MIENKAEKSLRWIVNQIPDFTPKSNEEKMLLAIKLYAESGAEEIKKLEEENSALRARIDKTVDIPSIQKTTIWAWDIDSGNSIECDSYMILYPDYELKGYIHCKDGFNTEEEAKEELQKCLAELRVEKK